MFTIFIYFFILFAKQLIQTFFSLCIHLFSEERKKKWPQDGLLSLHWGCCFDSCIFTVTLLKCNRNKHYLFPSLIYKVSPQHVYLCVFFFFTDLNRNLPFTQTFHFEQQGSRYFFIFHYFFLRWLRWSKVLKVARTCTQVPKIIKVKNTHNNIKKVDELSA